MARARTQYVRNSTYRQYAITVRVKARTRQEGQQSRQQAAAGGAGGQRRCARRREGVFIARPAEPGDEGNVARNGGRGITMGNEHYSNGREAQAR